MEGDLQRALGATVRAHRQARQLSQEAFADVLGVHRTYVGGVERGERNLTLRSVEGLATRMGVDPFDLFVRPATDRPARRRNDEVGGRGRAGRR